MLFESLFLFTILFYSDDKKNMDRLMEKRAILNYVASSYFEVQELLNDALFHLPRSHFET
jgi:hypothetical protein